ncbi:Crp/Fnr family transcriptional regulator [Chryseobacterium populi]|uniref:cAMP-binding protein n=1 Tax=Chryseobacterium populi TaxID=1144316 RepID=J2SQG6_9FLAO|nr:cyclic nucleotide-binding domain-containing protein [Chryseobacterium populi]EJL67782.1 cAMP-binding protein [Chryseobacterium populi]
MENNPLTQLIENIESLFPLNDSEILLLKDNLNIFNTDRESSIISPLSVADKLFFLQKGVVRSFYQKDYKEINTEFFFENEFFTAFTSFLTQEKTNLYFQCIEQCDLISIPKALMDKLLREDTKWNILLNNILAKEYIKKCRRESSFLLMDANERYHYFLKQFPDADTRIPLFHIASYLGISPETLSRIRSKKINQIDLSQVNNI